VASPDTSFAQETVDSFEIGLKTQFFNRALTMNFALFSQKFENFQLNTFNGISFVVASVPEVLSDGLEMDFRFRTPVEGLVVSGGFAYTDARYGDDLGSPTQAGSFVANNLTSSPKETMSLAVNYDRPLLNGIELNTYFDMRYVGDHNTGSDLWINKVQESYKLFNGSIGFSSEDGNWSLDIWGRNLLDERYAQIIFNSPLQGDGPSLVQTSPGVFAPRTVTTQLDAFVGEPRMFGATLRMRY
jgi:iron complex outermembrane recepter protein